MQTISDRQADMLMEAAAGFCGATASLIGRNASSTESFAKETDWPNPPETQDWELWKQWIAKTAAKCHELLSGDESTFLEE